MKFDFLIRAHTLVSPVGPDQCKVSENTLVGIIGNNLELVSEAPKDWKAKYKAKKYLDFDQHIVMPGLVNAHTHLPMTLFRGLAEDMQFHEWLNDYILPIERDLLNKEFVRVGTELAAWECITQGVTCVNDMYYFTEEILSVLDRAGLRGYVGQTFMSFSTPDNKKNDDSNFKTVEKLAKKYSRHPRLRPSIGPHAPYTCNDELFKKVRDLANKWSLHLHTHVSETKFEVDESLKLFGKTPVQRLFDLGAMKGSTSFAHGIHLTDQDIELIRKTNCGVIHNPESNMKISAGVCRVQDLLKKGVRLGLGTDGAASNNNLNMLQEMDVGVKLQKLHGATQVTAKNLFYMATLGSAKSLELDRLVGSIEIGKRADLVAVELNHPQMQPLHDPVAQLVYSASGSEVSHVICDGQMLMKDKKLLTLDTKKISQSVLKFQNQIKKFLATRRT